jgi:hypothetical protein
MEADRHKWKQMKEGESEGDLMSRSHVCRSSGSLSRPVVLLITVTLTKTGKGGRDTVIS